LSSRSIGNTFEDSFEASCKRSKVFFSRNRDVYIPPDLRKRVSVPKNLYDYFMFANKTLFPLELKTTKDSNLPFKNIKDHQLTALEDATKFDDTISGLLINFREPENKVYFIHILDFLQYQKVTKGEEENTYKSKVNRSSIPAGICEEIGIEVGSKLLKVNYSYHVKELIVKAIKKYGA
jgi:penicillin-binding protein-related factor A (putative recombinase)